MTQAQAPAMAHPSVAQERLEFCGSQDVARWQDKDEKDLTRAAAPKPEAP